MVKSRAEEVEDQQREAQVLELRKAGMSFNQIARAMDPPYVDHTGPLKAYHRAMRKMLEEPAKELRELESARLESLWATWYPKAIAGNGPALDRCLRISKARRELLGLDVPVTINYRVSLEQQQEIERLAAELGVLDPTNLGQLEALPADADEDADESEPE